MFSLKTKSHSCKTLIHATIHEPLQIRIGKKNKYLLNQSGIHNLSSLYSKYRSINNIQLFKQWLQYDIGFTAYQANMTTCGIGSKLGEIKEINTGLTPICCPTHEKRGRKQKLITEQIKKRKIKSDTSLSSLTQEVKEKPMNKLPDNYLTGVKSPDDQELALRHPSIKNKDESSLSSSSDILSKLSEQTKINTKLFKSESDFDFSDRDTSKLEQEFTSNPDNIFEVSFKDDKSKESSLTNIRDPSSNTPLNNENQFPRKSILRNTQSKSISLLNADTLLSAIKQQSDGKPFKIIQSLEKDWPKTAINYGIDSGLQPKLNEMSPDTIDNQSISAIKRSYASLPISTPAIFPKKPKSMEKSDTSFSTKLSSSNTPLTDEKPTLLPNESERRKFSKEIDKTINQIFENAVHIVALSKVNSHTQSSEQMKFSPLKSSITDSFTKLVPIDMKQQIASSKDQNHFQFCVISPNGSSKQQLFDNNKSKDHSIFSPSWPIPCNALWDNVSKHKHQINPNNHNQNYHSSTTLFTFIQQQQQQELNEHIFYIKQTKPS